MSVWDKDKAFAKDGPLKEWAGIGNKFILFGVTMVNPAFETSIGTAPMIHLDVANLTAPDNHAQVSVIGDTIGGKFFDQDDEYAPLITDGDFPAIVETAEVESSEEAFGNAYVIRFVDAYNKTTAKEHAKA
jgi:hypothetical protein